MTCQSICDTLLNNSLGQYVAIWAYNEIWQDRSKVYFIEKGQLGCNLVGLTENQTTFHNIFL